MAQTVRSDQKPATGPAAPGEKPSILGRLGTIGGSIGGALTSSRARSAERPKSGAGRFFLGMLILMIGSQVLFYVEAVVFVALHLSQQAHIWPASTPILGGLTPFLLIYLLLIIALWYGLYRFKIIPRDPFGVKSQQTARANASASATSIPGTRKTRADRRHATVVASTTPTKGGAKPAKPMTVVEAAPPREHDATYQQVRAMQKNRRRREVKR